MKTLMIAKNSSTPEASSICTAQPAATSTPTNLIRRSPRLMALRRDLTGSGDSSLVSRIPLTFAGIKGRRPIRAYITPKKTTRKARRTPSSPNSPMLPTIVKKPMKTSNNSPTEAPKDSPVKSPNKQEFSPKPDSPEAGTSSALSAQRNERKRSLFQGPSTSTGFETPTKQARLSVLKVNMVSPFSINREKEIKSVFVDGDSRTEVPYEITPNVDQQVVLPERHEGPVEPENQIQEDSFQIQPKARDCRETSTNTEISIPPYGKTLRKGCSIM
ncbi:uncharacterized protein LOC108138090 [Drosophila elegans]|uniref:uncharacterized protein LOC108138090 n=1 Tax=Drosophila elegans TaxID=30023 RepID=UPI0007E7CC04|nr:uncharacterized protein LOC108138090 [Drosophila elegans]